MQHTLTQIWTFAAVCVQAKDVVGVAQERRAGEDFTADVSRPNCIVTHVSGLNCLLPCTVREPNSW